MKKVKKIFITALSVSILMPVFAISNVNASCGVPYFEWDFKTVDLVVDATVEGVELTKIISAVGGDSEPFEMEIKKYELIVNENLYGYIEPNTLIQVDDFGEDGFYYEEVRSLYDVNEGDRVTILLQEDGDGTYSMSSQPTCGDGALIKYENENYSRLIGNNIKNPLQDSVDSVFYDYIQANYFDGVSNGYRDEAYNEYEYYNYSRLYKPDQDITRGELVEMYGRAFDLDFVDTINEFNPDFDKFDDVYTESTRGNYIWHTTPGGVSQTSAGYIVRMQYMGIIHGFEDNTFRPNDSITRNEAAKILVNLLKYEGRIDGDANYENVFPDVTEDNKFYEFVSVLNSLEAEGEKIVKGYEDGEFKGEEKITRGQAAKIVYLSSRV